jgi:hypothetical protein
MKDMDKYRGGNDKSGILKMFSENLAAQLKKNLPILNFKKISRVDFLMRL